MNYLVQLTQEAEQDLLDLWEYVESHDLPGKADALLEQLERTCQKLTRLPHRGHIPPELKRVGVDAYREIHYKPYRIVYEVRGRNVFVHAVLDGRRDLPSILAARLLR